MTGRSGGSGRSRRGLLVFFSAWRSGPARRMESLLAQLARKERHRLSVTNVDVEAQPELAERFKFARQKSRLAGTIRGSYFEIKNEH